MAHLDLDEAEANAMNLQSRFYIFANDAMMAACAGKPKFEYLEVTIVNKGDIVTMPANFITFADKRAFVTRDGQETTARSGIDYQYGSANSLMFLKPGSYKIPMKTIWHFFQSNTGDSEVIDMPVDIALTLPIYIAAICLEMDNYEKANLKRAEFELALSRCTSTDFMPNNSVPSSW